MSAVYVQHVGVEDHLSVYRPNQTGTELSKRFKRSNMSHTDIQRLIDLTYDSIHVLINQLGINV